MSNLKSRIGKANAVIEKTMEEDAKVFFWRDDPDISGEQEKRFCEENPDFKGKIYVYHFGRANLNPNIPDAY